MPSTAPFAAVDQGDVAFLEYEGIAYRCYVWQRNTAVTEGENRLYRGQRIEAALYVEGAHGQSVLVYRAVVRTPGTGDYVDCPRIVAYGRGFAVHWIEYDPTDFDGLEVADGRTLHRATINVTATPYAWTHQGSVATSYFQLYDVHSMAATEDYVLAHAGTPTSISVLRVNGDAWIDTQWNVSVAVASLQQNVLAVIADRQSPVILYQGGNALRGASVEWDDGATALADVSILASPGGQLTAITGTRVGDGDDGEVFIAYEYQDTSASVTLPAVRAFSASAASLGSPSTRSTTPNVTLESKLWTYNSQRQAASFTDTPMFFAGIGYVNRGADADYLQAIQYIARWEEPGTTYYGRPIPVATLSYGIANSIMHGDVPVAPLGTSILPTGPDNTKRRNHLPGASPGPSFGPLQKSYTTFLPKWTRFDASTAVAGAELRSTTFYHDNPWAYPVDVSDAALPSTPYASVSVPQLERVQAGDGSMIGGGTPMSYDGLAFVEAGFPWRPEILSLQELEDGSLASGTYTYAVVAEWRDNRGQTHRAVSDPVTITTTGGHPINVEVRMINLSMKDNDALGITTYPPVKLDIYRTTSGGTIFYPLYRGNADTAVDLIDVPLNDPTAFFFEVEDGQPDTTGVFPLQTRTPLPYSYTTGVWIPLLPEAPPALSALATWQNRVWGVASEDPSSIWYSQEILPEIGGERYSIPEFSPDLRYRIDGIGRVVAMHEMDSALIVFTRDSIHSLHGLPADATGSGASLQLQTLQVGTGCIEPRSVASAPDGLYFQSRRGLYHLSRQNALTYVGADVEDELRAAGNIRAVTVHEDSHQVRVLCNGAAYDSPQLLVYDWLMKLWAVWPLPAANPNAGRSSAVDAVDWRGHVGQHGHAVVLVSGLLVQKPTTSASRFADESGISDTVAIPVDVRTGWIHLAGLAGFKRVRKIGLHLTKPAAASYTVEIEYDIDGTQTTGANIQTEVVPSTAVGYHEFRTAIQKCTSLRIRIYEGTTAPTGAQLTASTINLHAITLVVARKPGLARVSPTSQRT